MPLYEYKCVKCGHRFEKIEGYSASETKKCPKCGAKAERQIASPAIQFKGSGWYVTDYAGKGKAPASESGGESSASKSEAKTDSKTESKPAETKPASEKPAAKKKK